MKRQSMIIFGIGICMILLATGVKLSSSTGFAANEAKTVGTAVGPLVGLKAPEFTLQDINGQKYVLSDVIKNSKVTLVNFWATWCPPCRGEIPELIDFYRKYGTQKVSLLGIDCQEEPANVKSFALKNKMNYPVLTDIEGKVAHLYNIYAIPTTFFVDSSGKIRDKIEGGTDMATLETKVKAIMKE